MLNIKKSALYASGLVVLGIAISVAGCGSGDNGAAPAGGTTSAATVTLTAGGSSFVNPAMGKWIDEYKKSNPSIEINYQSVGSGAGISQYQAGTFDFGATDAPVNDQDLKAMAPTIQVPIVSGAVALAYNLDGVSDLKLSPDVISGIFLGTIKTWNDPKIAADNPGAHAATNRAEHAHLIEHDRQDRPRELRGVRPVARHGFVGQQNMRETSDARGRVVQHDRHARP